MEPEQPQVPEWLQTILDQYGGYEMSDDDIMALSNYMLMAGVEQQAGKTKYDADYLAFLNKKLGVDEQGLAQAQQELDFQQGEYWDFYTGPYMELQRQQTANALEMSNNEVAKSRDYAIAQTYNTQSAKYGADANKYQYLIATGQITPPRASTSSGRRGFSQDAYSPGGKGYGY